MAKIFVRVSIGALLVGLGIGTLVLSVSNKSLENKVVALASTTAKVQEEYKVIGDNLTIDANKRTFVFEGFGPLFLLRRNFISADKPALKSEIVIPKGCQMAKPAQQGGYGIFDEGKVITIGFVLNEDALNVYKNGQVDIYELNCK